MPTRVGLIGLGKSARVCVDAIARVDGLELAGGYDAYTKPEWWEERPWFPSMSALLEQDLDTVLIATPSGTHPDVVREVWAIRPKLQILVEKPLAVSSTEAHALLAQAPSGNVTVLYHAAYAPEVGWAEESLPSWEAVHGSVMRYLCFFSDPYDTKEMGDKGRVSYGNSWVDSGINCLSVLRRLHLVDAVTKVSWDPTQLSTAIASTRFYGEKTGTIITQWTVTAASKSTVLFFGDGAVAVVDHQGSAGRVVDKAGSIEGLFGVSADVPRLVRHYEELFRREVVERRRVFESSDHALLHSMLLDLL